MSEPYILAPKPKPQPQPAERGPDHRELLLGCGSTRDRRINVKGWTDWANLTTLDYEPSHHPDVVHDLRETPWPFPDDTFDEIHAYEVIEHIGAQGDYVAFFAHFYEAWRILKPGGVFVGSCPWFDSMWAWGDPGHTRIIAPASFVYLDRQEYHNQIGVTAMTDYRSVWGGDFECIWSHKNDETHLWALVAHKPIRYPEEARHS